MGRKDPAFAVCNGGRSGGNAYAWGISAKLYISLTQSGKYDKGSIKKVKLGINFTL